MKHTLRCTVIWILNKVKVEVHVVMNDSFQALQEYTGNNRRMSTYNILPSLVINILHPRVEGEERPPWNPNDSLLLTKYYLPIFYRELQSIYDGMKTPNLYTYTDGRLELDEVIGETIRKVFMIGNTTVELAPVVLLQDKPDGTERLEGIRMKFNNDSSMVVLTLNEVYSILWNLNHLDMDVLGMELYNLFITSGVKVSDRSNISQDVDIKPLQKSEEF